MRGNRGSVGLLSRALVVLVLFGGSHARSGLVPCERMADTRRIGRALERIALSVDPCGESAEVRAVLATLGRCSRMSYEICTDTYIERNLFDRPVDEHGRPIRRTISWNPTLRSELESGCDRDPAMPVRRDPTASLLHELVHAAHDCEGLNPGERELEAVRIENIYRRAAGLCQRPGYGDERLPASMVRDCAPGRCSCAVHGADGELARRAHPSAPDGRG